MPHIELSSTDKDSYHQLSQILSQVQQEAARGRPWAMTYDKSEGESTMTLTLATEKKA